MTRQPASIATLGTIAIAYCLLGGIAVPANAQQLPDNTQQVSPTITFKEEKPIGITVEFNQAPLMTALNQLLSSARVNFSVAPNLPNTFVTLKCSDLPFESVLKMILRAGSTPGIQLTYRYENGVYIIEPKPASDPIAPVPSQFLYRLPLAYAGADKVVGQVRLFFPPGTVTITAPESHTLLVQTTEEQLESLRRLVSMVDIEQVSLVIRASIVYVSPQGKRRVLQSMMLKTLQDQEASSDQESNGALPQQRTRFQVKVRPQLRQDNSCEVTSQWDISLPLSTLGVTKGNIRLDKHLTTTSHIAPHQNLAIGEIAGDQWGGVGKIVLELSADSAK